jgi:UDP-N-acetylglucosamine transferase subunit ALG13
MNFMKQSLMHENQDRIMYHVVENDFGFVLHTNSIELDLLEMDRKYDQFLDRIEDYVEQETRFLQYTGVNLVISDISPLPFMAAKNAVLPSIGISNFTWYTAYQDIFANEKLQILYNAYNQMDYFIPLCGAYEPKWKKKVYSPMGYFCREMNQVRVDRIRQQINKSGDQFLVYFGLGMKIGMNDLSDLQLWNSEGCVFVVSGNTPITGRNIYKIPSDETETQDYIAACDMIISKPGWGTVSEAVQSRTPLLILERNHMREDQATKEYLVEMGWAQSVTWSELGRFLITDLVKQEMRERAKRICPVENNMVLEQITNIIWNIPN